MPKAARCPGRRITLTSETPSDAVIAYSPLVHVGLGTEERVLTERSHFVTFLLPSPTSHTASFRSVREVSLPLRDDTIGAVHRITKLTRTVVPLLLTTSIAGGWWWYRLGVIVVSGIVLVV